jgi:hypothetical protein
MFRPDGAIFRYSGDLQSPVSLPATLPTLASVYTLGRLDEQEFKKTEPILGTSTFSYTYSENRRWPSCWILEQTKQVMPETRSAINTTTK